MIIHCQQCGLPVRVVRRSTGGLVVSIAMLVVVAGGVAYRSVSKTTSKDTARIGLHIGEIGR